MKRQGQLGRQVPGPMNITFSIIASVFARKDTKKTGKAGVSLHSGFAKVKP
jgi:hypothetical protein